MQYLLEFLSYLSQGKIGTQRAGINTVNRSVKCHFFIDPISVTLSSRNPGYPYPVQTHVYPFYLESSSLHPLPLVTRLSHSVARARGADSAPSIKKRTNACSVEPCILLTSRPFFTVTTYLTLNEARLAVGLGICNGYSGGAWSLLFLWDVKAIG